MCMLIITVMWLQLDLLKVLHEQAIEYDIMHLPLLQPDYFKNMMPQLILYLMSCREGSEASGMDVQPLIMHGYQLRI